MTIPKDNTARDSLFALDMLTVESRESRSVSRLKACQTLHSAANADNSAATVRPSK